MAARLIFPTKQGGCIQTVYLVKPCFVLSPNSHAEIIWKLFVDTARAIAGTVQTIELFEWSSATAQGLSLSYLQVWALPVVLRKICSSHHLLNPFVSRMNIFIFLHSHSFIFFQIAERFLSTSSSLKTQRFSAIFFRWLYILSMCYGI